jgi:outer membrane protein TolC
LVQFFNINLFIRWLFFLNGCLWLPIALATTEKTTPSSAIHLYRWVQTPQDEHQQVNEAHARLKKAIHDPEYLLDHWINLPTSPDALPTQKVLQLSLREAILLALRYNPNIQNAELDRITQRYQLRLAHNEFELQYALAGTSAFEKSHYSRAGSTTTRSYVAAPEFDLKTKLGSTASLKMDNTIAAIGNYSPLLTLSVSQPLLRGFGISVNEAALLDAIEAENLNKLSTEQSVMDQITQVIGAYRALILSSNNLKNQRWQLTEAQKTFEINKKKIAAGQLEPTANVQQSYQIESLSLMVEQAENGFKTGAQDLLQTIGLDPDMRLAVPSDVSLDKLSIPDTDASIDQALHHNTEYLGLQAGLRADERAYLVAKNQQLWQLDLAANIQTGTLTSIDNNAQGLRNIYNGSNVNESAAVTMTIPLHDISRRSQLISAKIRLEKDRLQLITARRIIITTIKNTINSITSEARQYELANRQVALAEQSYALEKKKQQAGIASALDVSNTQNQLIQAQMGLINAKIAYLNQLSALQRTIGTTLLHWKIKLRYTG